MIALKERIKKLIWSNLKEHFPLELEKIDIAPTPQIKFGDLALAFPFHLAKLMKKPPRELAQKIAPQLSSLPGISKAEAAGGGYINLFLDRELFFLDQIRSLASPSLKPEEKKVIIEHTNINPNKAAHIGHLRNAVLGDTLSRCLKYKGENVEVQNYIDDTGIQVVDVVLGFMDIEKKNLDEIKKIPGKFDYYCWDLYTKAASFLADNPGAKKRKSTILKHIENNQDPEAGIAHYISRRILKAHLETMKRIDVTYDVLPCESSILFLRFWDKAFQKLKEKKALYYVKKGVNQGCWVMALDEEEEKEKIIVRSDGTITYVGKDIAYQLWKFGLLEKDFHYKPFIKENGRTIWITDKEEQENAPSFGNGSLVYNVIDSRQAYLQKIVVQGLKSLKYLKEAKNSIHFSYEMVALSPKSLKDLDIPLSKQDEAKSFHEVSGRKGLGIKADDLLDRLDNKALDEVKTRNPDLSLIQQQDIAHKIAIGALRYFMLKFARNSLIVFDFEEALHFEGETGPYLQYTSVRINSIFRKLHEKENFDRQHLSSLSEMEKIDLDSLAPQEYDDFWEVILYASQYEEEILHSIQSLEFSQLAKFTFNLCQKFNAYYHKYSILSEKDKNIKRIRILVIHDIQTILNTILSLMGIPVPDRM